VKKLGILVAAALAIGGVGVTWYVVGRSQDEARSEDTSSDVPVAATSGSSGPAAAEPGQSAPPPGYSPFAGSDTETEKKVRCATHPDEIRPVSRMVEVEHKGKPYYLCCPDCAKKFLADPEPYIRELERAEASGGS
jgi:YHS domain-containing protein